MILKFAIFCKRHKIKTIVEVINMFKDALKLKQNNPIV